MRRNEISGCESLLASLISCVGGRNVLEPMITAWTNAGDFVDLAMALGTGFQIRRVVERTGGSLRSNLLPQCLFHLGIGQFGPLFLVLRRADKQANDQADQ